MKTSSFNSILLSCINNVFILAPPQILDIKIPWKNNHTTGLWAIKNTITYRVCLLKSTKTFLFHISGDGYFLWSEKCNTKNPNSRTIKLLNFSNPYSVIDVIPHIKLYQFSYIQHSFHLELAFITELTLHKTPNALGSECLRVVKSMLITLYNPLN